MIIKHSNADRSQIIARDISPPSFSTTGLANIKKISVFDDAPHPFGIETLLAILI